MKLGVTGSREGMTLSQLTTFLRMIEKEDFEELHQGCCNGADEMAVIACYDKNIKIIGHPPTNHKELSETAVEKSSELMAEKEYLQRNKDIVDSSDILIAFPKGTQEETRSGTWSTVRYARKKNARIVIIYPNGAKHVSWWR
jgi:predicted Rossmann-fold nucleotide-binding protein